MAYHRCWEQGKLDRYFTTESMSKDREAFLTVHLPIGRIRVDRELSRSIEKDYIDEQALLQIVTDSRAGQPNRIFVISGETGSGKSELCQWLSYKIAGGKHVPILIARSMTRLADIVSEVTRHLGETMPSNVREITALMPETVSSTLRAAMYQRLERETVRQRIGLDFDKLRTLLDAQEFERLMRRNFEQYVSELKQLEKARTLDLLPEVGFRDTFMKVIQGFRRPGICYEELQQAIVECLAEQLNVEDLLERLRRVAQRYAERGQRPVLLIEDITTFQFLHNDLLDYLYDLSSGNFDVVLGVTTGFERANAQRIYKSQETSRDRTEARFVLTDEKNETLFLGDRESYIALARSYLRAVRTPGCENCGPVGRLASSFDGDLYPFNREFLERVYQGLTEDGSSKRTPRLFLTRTLYPALKSDQPPSDAIELLPVTRAQELFSGGAALAPSAQRIVRWYGKACRDGVYTPLAIFEAFGVPLPASVEQAQGYVVLPLRIGLSGNLPEPPVQRTATPPAPKPAPNPGLPPPRATVTPVAKTIQPPQPPPNDTNERDIKVFGEFDAWMERRGGFPQREYLKTGVVRLLSYFGIDPYQLAGPEHLSERDPIRYTRGKDGQARVFLEGSGDDKASSDLRLTLQQEASHKELLNQMLAVGLGTLKPGDPDVNLAGLSWYLRGRAEQFQQELRGRLQDALGMPAEQFVLMARFLLSNNITGCDRIEDAIRGPAPEGGHLQFQELTEPGRRLALNGPFIDHLYVLFFHVRGNVVDFSVLRESAGAISGQTDALVAKIKSINVDRVPEALEVKRRDNERASFRDIVKVVRDYAAALDRYRSELGKRYTASLKVLGRLADATQGAEDYGDRFVAEVRQQFQKLLDLADTAGLTTSYTARDVMLRLERPGLDFVGVQHRVAAAEHTYRGTTPSLFSYLGLQRALLTLESKDETQIARLILDYCEGLREQASRVSEKTANQSGPETMFRGNLAQLRKLTS